jgi:hypothetical protein
MTRFDKVNPVRKGRRIAGNCGSWDLGKRGR